MIRLILAFLLFAAPAYAQQGQAVGPNPPCAAFGTASGTCLQGAGALGSPSSIGTLPAFTLGGTIAGGGNQINNVIIGAVTPLAGSFTTLGASGIVSLTNSTDATAIGTAGAVFSGGISVAKQVLVGTNLGVGIVPVSGIAAQINVAAGIDLAVRTNVAAAGAVLISAINDSQGANIPMEFRASKFFFTTGIGSDAASTDNSLCLLSTGQVAIGSGTLGSCLGTSGRQFKTDFIPMIAGLDEIAKLNLWNYRYKSGQGDDGARMQYGPTAQDVEQVLPDLVGHDEKGEAINYDIGAFIPISLRAIQQLKMANDNLRACQQNWKCRIFGQQVK